MSIPWRAEALGIQVEVDGVGIAESVLRDGGRAGHYGLPGMLERAAGIGAQLTLRRLEHAGAGLLLTVLPVGYQDLQARDDGSG